MFMDLETVKKFLPHRDPFLFIDCIEKLEYPQAEPLNGRFRTLREIVGTQIVAHYKIKEDMEILKGHFPGNPIVPGVCQIEMMAQASAMSLVGCVEDLENASIEVALLGAETCKFRKPVVPGMELVIYAECIKSRPPFSTYKCRIEHEGSLVSQAQVFASCKL